MARKKKSEEQIAQELQHQRRIAAGYIRESFPNVRKVNFDLTFEDFDKQVEPSNKKYSWGPEQSALFEFDCPYYECVRGGFNLSGSVRVMLQDKLPEISGDLTCQGWQDRERIGKHHCYCKMTYKVSAEYE